LFPGFHPNYFLLPEALATFPHCVALFPLARQPAERNDLPPIAKWSRKAMKRSGILFYASPEQSASFTPFFPVFTQFIFPIENGRSPLDRSSRG
jgi:hypothetical protein